MEYYIKAKGNTDVHQSNNSIKYFYCNIYAEQKKLYLS